MVKYLFPVRFAIGAAAAEPLSSEFLEFCEWLAGKLARERYSVRKTGGLHTIPISNSEIFERPSSIYTYLQEATEGHIIGIDVLFIDLSGPFQGPFRGSLQLHLGYSLLAVLESNPKSPELVILRLPEIPPEGDAFREVVEAFLESGRLAIVDNMCHVLPNHLASTLDVDEYLARKAQLRLDPKELLELKMIRRLGHFARHDQDGRHVGCQRYFYDGRRCVGEVADVISQYLRDRMVGGGVAGSDAAIVTFSPKSPWLREAVLAVAGNLNMRCYEAGDEVGAAEIPTFSRIFVVVDLVDTGSSVKRIDQTLRERNGEEVSVEYFSVLSTNEDKDRGIRQIGTLDIHFSLLVDQHSWPLSTCPMCKIGIPLSDEEDDEYDMLTSYDMWEMTDSGGYKEEVNVPAQRPSLGIVPDYPAIIRRHGAWIAYKVERCLQSVVVDLVDRVIVCPDEFAPRAMDKYLQQIMKATVVRVPRDVLDEIGSEKFDFSSLGSRWGKEIWFLRLSSISVSGVVVLDEFHVSGVTFSALAKLIVELKISVLCYFPIVDFNPVRSSKVEVPVLSLYSFQAA